MNIVINFTFSSRCRYTCIYPRIDPSKFIMVFRLIFRTSIVHPIRSSSWPVFRADIPSFISPNGRIYSKGQRLMVPPDGFPLPSGHLLLPIIASLVDSHQLLLQPLLLPFQLFEPFQLRLQPRRIPLVRHLVLVPIRVQLPRLVIPGQAEFEPAFVVIRVAAVVVSVSRTQVPALWIILHEAERCKEVRGVVVAERLAFPEIFLGAATVAPIVTVVNLFTGHDLSGRLKQKRPPWSLRFFGEGVQLLRIVRVVRHVVYRYHQRILVPRGCQPICRLLHLIIHRAFATLHPRLVVGIPPHDLVGGQFVVVQELLREEGGAGLRPLSRHGSTGQGEEVSDVRRARALIAELELLC
mmetsp:Transcript_7515/g.18646  ORF Transcript_7515/g.18646 Transcript_7515/m.18646 type:complete len:353 (-) Transcript_7515:516-1574(-)